MNAFGASHPESRLPYQPSHSGEDCRRGHCGHFWLPPLQEGLGASGAGRGRRLPEGEVSGLSVGTR